MPSSRCEVITSSGKRCKNKAMYMKRGKSYCTRHYKIHQDKAWGKK